MVIILVHWLIKKGHEKDFVAFWSKMTVRKKKGLFRETLTKPSLRDDPKFNTFSITDTSYSTFINIGMWKSLDDFDREIGKYIPKTRQKRNRKTGRVQTVVAIEEFEFKIRERIVLKVVGDRDGGESLPPTSLGQTLSTPKNSAQEIR